jgi:CPA2 family monovalent cation:H+ antiporter-2
MGHELLVLGGAFLVAGLLARAGNRVGLPTIPLFMAAGILLGPNTPGPVLFEHPEDLELLATFGLIFLLFYLGVEFSIDDLTGGGTRLVASAAIYLALNVGAGLALGFAFGWGTKEAFVVAGITGISSSAIVTKVVVELRRLANPETPLILGIIVIEDLFLALYLAVLAPVLGDAESAGEAALLFLRAFAFLVVLGAAARWGTPLVEKLLGSRSDELLVVLFIGLALAVAGAADALGVSDAIGAFMAGLLVSGTLVAARVRRLVLPLRDAFAAVFFFAFGLAIDPSDIGSIAGAVAAATVTSIVLAIVAGLATARLNRLDRKAAANIAFTVLSRGEFALVLVTLATQAGLDARLAPFAATYVLILAIASPILASRSRTLARWFPKGLDAARQEQPVRARRTDEQAATTS